MVLHQVHSGWKESRLHCSSSKNGENHPIRAEFCAFYAKTLSKTQEVPCFLTMISTCRKAKKPLFVTGIWVRSVYHINICCRHVYHSSLPQTLRPPDLLWTWMEQVGHDKDTSLFIPSAQESFHEYPG